MLTMQESHDNLLGIVESLSSVFKKDFEGTIVEKQLSKAIMEGNKHKKI